MNKFRKVAKKISTLALAGAIMVGSSIVAMAEPITISTYIYPDGYPVNCGYQIIDDRIKLVVFMNAPTEMEMEMDGYARSEEGNVQISKYTSEGPNLDTAVYCDDGFTGIYIKFNGWSMDGGDDHTVLDTYF